MRLPIALVVLATLAACNDSASTDPVTVIDGGSLRVTDAEIAATPAPTIPFDVVIDPTSDAVENQPGADGLVERQPDTCGASDLQVFVGQAANSVPDPGRPVRIIAPGAIVTQEYDPTRINLFTDDAGLIVRITCG